MLYREPYIRQPGPGVARAAVVVQRVRDNWKDTPFIPRVTRQQLRARARRAAKGRTHV